MKVKNITTCQPPPLHKIKIRNPPCHSLMRELSEKEIATFQRKILSFYENEGRSLPWRQTRDKYKIMVSELMLQQTQVKRVIEKYERWIERFPTAEALAKAPLSEVLKM